MSLTLAAEPDCDPDPHSGDTVQSAAVLSSWITSLGDPTGHVYSGEKSGGMIRVGLFQFYPGDTHGMEVGFHSTYR